MSKLKFEDKVKMYEEYKKGIGYRQLEKKHKFSSNSL